MKGLRIPEGNVIKITDAIGRILWAVSSTPGDVGDNYPTLPSGGSVWYQSSYNKLLITKIAIYDSYTPTGTEPETWVISDNITGYRKGSTAIIAGDGSGKINANPDFSQFFYGFTGVTSITGLEYINTYHVTNMNYLFGNCSKLSSVDVSSFDTRNVVTMTGLFSSCQALTALDMANFNTARVTDMSKMFQYCSGLTQLDLTSFYTGNVITTNSMFSNCSNLTNITGTYGKWVIQDDCDIDFMFSGCGTDHVTLIGAPAEPDEPDIPEPDTSNYPMLAKAGTWCSGLSAYEIADMTKITFVDFYTPTGSEDKRWAADLYGTGSITCYLVGTELIVAGNGSGGIKAHNNCYKMFVPGASHTTPDYGFYFENVTSISGLTILDTSDVTNMTAMFDHCKSVTSLDLTSFDTGKVTNMSGMFVECRSLALITASNNKWTTANADTTAMFYNCGTNRITLVDAPAEPDEPVYDTYPVLAPNTTWYKSNVAKNTFYTISIVDSYTPTGTETESWAADKDNTGSIMCYIKGTTLIIAGNGSGRISANPNSRCLFGRASLDDPLVCFALVENINGLDILDVSNVEDAFSMFMDCFALRSLGGINNWNTSNITNMLQMFSGCRALTTIDLSNWNTSNVANMRNMFGGCVILQNATLTGFDTSNVVDMGSMFISCYKLTTIYVSRDKWVIRDDCDITGMFTNCGTSTLTYV